MKNTEKTMEKLVALCKNRGFIYAGSEIYGGLANSWDYGPSARSSRTTSKRPGGRSSCRKPLERRPGFGHPHEPAGLGSLRPRHHLQRPLIDCKACKMRHRADKLIEDWLKEKPRRGRERRGHDE